MTRLRAALITPLTGPLAPFGQAGATGLALWARHAARLPPPWTGVDLDVRDSGGDVRASVHAALQDNPDVLFGPYGSYPMLEAARSCPQVFWNHGGATSRLARPAFPQVINVLSPASSYFTGALQAVHVFNAEAKTVVLLHSTSGFGRDVAAGAVSTARTLSFAIEHLAFEPGHAAAAASLVPRADVLLVVGSFSDECAAAPILLRRPWRAAAFVGAGVEEVLAPLGSQREGLLGPAQWIASAALPPDEGPDADWFVTRYQGMARGEPSYPAAQAFAAGLLCARCLRDSGPGEDVESAQLAAAHQLACTTLFGAFRLDPQSGLQAGHETVVVQWQQGVRRVVWPPEQAERPLLVLPPPLIQ